MPLLENHRGDQSPPNLFVKQVFFVLPVWTKMLGIAVTKFFQQKQIGQLGVWESGGSFRTVIDPNSNIDYTVGMLYSVWSKLLSRVTVSMEKGTTHLDITHDRPKMTYFSFHIWLLSFAWSLDDGCCFWPFLMIMVFSRKISISFVAACVWVETFGEGDKWSYVSVSTIIIKSSSWLTTVGVSAVSVKKNTSNCLCSGKQDCLSNQSHQEMHTLATLLLMFLWNNKEALYHKPEICFLAKHLV